MRIRASMLPLAAAVCVSLTLIVGCGGSDRELVDVQGRVTYQGKPVAKAVLGFSPTEVSMGASQRPATAITGDDGIYRLKAFRDQFGMPPGDYRVSVLCYEGSMAEPATVRYLVPKKYSDADTSGLVAQVPQERKGTLEINFDIP
jgi:hypothetical protein